MGVTPRHGITIHIPFNKMTDEQQEHIWNAEDELHKAGVHFDTGFGSGVRDWKFDWSLTGLYATCKRCNYDSRE